MDFGLHMNASLVQRFLQMQYRVQNVVLQGFFGIFMPDVAPAFIIQIINTLASLPVDHLHHHAINFTIYPCGVFLDDPLGVLPCLGLHQTIKRGRVNRLARC